VFLILVIPLNFDASMPLSFSNLLYFVTLKIFVYYIGITFCPINDYPRLHLLDISSCTGSGEILPLENLGGSMLRIGLLLEIAKYLIKWILDFKSARL